MTCIARIEAEPEMSLGTAKVKFSYELRVLPMIPCPSNCPTKRTSPKSVDGSGQGDDPQATMPIARPTSISPASAL